MKRILFLLSLSLSVALYAATSSLPANTIAQDSPAEKLMTRLLDVVKSGNAATAQQLVRATYCPPCLQHVLMETHMAVLTALQKEFKDHSIVQQKTKGLSTAVLLQSTVSKKF